MPHDFGLLFDTILFKLPAGFEAVIVTAPRMTVQYEVPGSFGLRLPDMRHLVDEESLAVKRLCRKILAVRIAHRVEMDMSARCHGDAARLKRKPFAAPYRHFRVVDGVPEN